MAKSWELYASAHRRLRQHCCSLATHRPYALDGYWDLATGVLAILALLTAKIRPLFWLFVVAFHLVGTIDLVRGYYHAIHSGLPALAFDWALIDDYSYVASMPDQELCEVPK